MADEKQVGLPIVSILLVEDSGRMWVCSVIASDLVSMLDDAEKERISRLVHQCCLDLSPVLMKAIPPKLSD